MATIDIASRTIGESQPTFIVAEAGVNHDGDVRTAIALIDAAVDARVDAIKFQLFDPETIVTRDAAVAPYQQIDASITTQRELLRGLALAAEDWVRLRDHAAHREILFFASVFDLRVLDLALELSLPAIKLGSGELTNVPLMQACASTGLPLLISTGMANLEEIRLSVDAVEGRAQYCLLHCVTAYPCPTTSLNLKAIPTLRNTFNVPVGMSDHSASIDMAPAIVALGAAVVEKHLTLDVRSAGPDHAASLDPAGFSRFVDLIRETEAALGDGNKRLMEIESELVPVVRKHVVASREVRAGYVLTPADMSTARTGGSGVPSAEFDWVIGRRARRDIRPGTPIRHGDVE